MIPALYEQRRSRGISAGSEQVDVPDLGWQELSIILVIVVIIFGAGRLPEIGGALGKTIKEFKAGSEGALDGQAKAGTSLSQIASSPDPLTATASRQVRADEI